MQLCTFENKLNCKHCTDNLCFFAFSLHLGPLDAEQKLTTHCIPNKFLTFERSHTFSTLFTFCLLSRCTLYAFDLILLELSGELSGNGIKLYFHFQCKIVYFKAHMRGFLPGIKISSFEYCV